MDLYRDLGSKNSVVIFTGFDKTVKVVGSPMVVINLYTVITIPYYIYYTIPRMIHSSYHKMLVGIF